MESNMLLWKDRPLSNEINELQNKEWEITQKIKEMKKTNDGWSPVADGIIKIEYYLSAPVKILWILKEPNYSKNCKDYESKEDYENRKQERKDLVHTNKNVQPADYYLFFCF
jgi:hypothetical protein